MPLTVCYNRALCEGKKNTAFIELMLRTSLWLIRAHINRHAVTTHDLWQSRLPFPLPWKRSLWVRKSKAWFVNALTGPSSDGDVIVSHCALPHSLFFHLITLSFLHLPSGPLLASVTMLHGLNSKARMQAKVQGQNISQLVLWQPSATPF